MNKKFLFVAAMIFAVSGISFAQTKTITNADLEKYRQKRLQAERELRENYAELGFPSPEELERQNEIDRQEFIDLSERFASERIAEEDEENYYQDGDVYTTNGNNARYPYPNPNFVDYGRYGGNFTPFYYYGNRRFNYGRNRRINRSNRNPANRRFKRPNNFRRNFIRNMPGYVRRNHNFTIIGSQ